MKIRYKIILSIVSVFLFVLLSVFVFQYFYTREFDNIVKLQSKSLESNINLYIAGDNFFPECNIFYNYNDKNKDSLVLNNIIERIIENYKIYAVYLYSSNNTLIKKVFCDTNISVSVPGDISEISKNFYFTDDSGLYIAKKVNINNVNKISNKEYFLLFIKMMDKETLEELKNEMAVDNVYISIVDKQQKKFNVDDDNCIIISKPLLNQNSIPVAYLYITKKLSLILNLVKVRNIFYVIFFISVLLLLFVIIFIVNKIINK
ncbi:MAG: hypothetical protein KA792_03230, partial [Bacteroidales bacterium]|nr:hypothetical protein [Bacteroidales bacterium]